MTEGGIDMKKQSSKKIKIKLPKKKRFHRFFLRRLLICTLAAVIGGAVLLQHNYLKDAENYTSDCSDAWKRDIEWMRSDYNSDRDDENITIDEKHIQTILNRITTSLDIFTNSPEPYADHAAMLIDAENLNYYVAQPDVKFFIFDAKNADYPNAKRKHRCISADSELSEQIETEMRDYAKKHYTRYALLSFCYGIIQHSYFIDEFFHPVLDALYQHFTSRIYDDPISVAVYLADDKVCGAEYGYTNYSYESSEFPIPFVFRQGTIQQGGVQELRNRRVTIRDGQHVYQKTDDEILPDEADLYDWSWLGMPQDTESGRAMAATAQEMENSQGKIQYFEDKYQKIIDDKSGKLLNEYYKEEAKQISDLYKQHGKDADYVPDYNKAMKNIESPEKKLEQLYKRFGGTPGEINYQQDTKFNWNRFEKFYSCGTETLQINGRTWYLFHYDHKDWLLMYLPLFILYGIAAAIGTILAALIWAIIAHIRFRHKFEMDEYRRNLTASLAHDLKSPLMAISSYSENLLNDVQPEKKHHYSKAILENTQYIDNIIVNVLELSRLETHEKTKRKFTDLTVLAKELLDGMQEQLDARGLTATVFGSCSVKANCEMMKQAIRNLLDNAVKFTPEGGSITVTGEKHSLSIVNDIAEERIDDPQRLSEAFVKGDEARSNRMGTGLGLSIVQQIAAQNRVRLHIDSSMHQFRVKLSQRAPIRLKHKRMARRETMDLTPLAGELLAGMQEQLDTRGLKISVSGRCIVNVERQMLTQSLRDLLNNAVKYTPEGGCITVTGKKHTLSIVSDMKAGLDQSNDAGSKCNSIEPALAAVQQTAAQNQIKLRIDSNDHQLRMQLKQNTLFSPICFRKIN